jgi:hypothetical protein
MESDNLERRMLASSKVTTPAVTGVITYPASIDAVVLRGPGLTAVPCALSQRSPNPEGGVRRSSQRKPNPEGKARRSPSSLHAVR